MSAHHSNAKSDRAVVEARQVSKSFGAFQALKNIDLTVDRGETIVVCGPSGSGKSTLIRCLNALEQYQSGSLRVCGVDVTDARSSIDAVRRRTGMVFQNFNLFPHLTVL